MLLLEYDPSRHTPVVLEPAIHLMEGSIPPGTCAVCVVSRRRSSTSMGAVVIPAGLPPSRYVSWHRVSGVLQRRRHSCQWMASAASLSPTSAGRVPSWTLLPPLLNRLPPVWMTWQSNVTVGCVRRGAAASAAIKARACN